MALSINSSTGVIDTSASTAGTYTVTYTTTEGVATTQVTIENCFANAYSVNFDGVNDRMDIADADSFSFGNGTSDSAFSISAWIKTTVGTGRGIISKYGSGGYEWIFWIAGPNKLRLSLYDNATSVYQSRLGTTDINTGNWTHVVATYDGRGGSGGNIAYQGIKLYINGTEESSYSDFSNGTYVAMHNTSRIVQIGSYNNAAFWTGNIDEIGVFNAELSASDVTNIYNSGSPADLSTYSSLVHYYRMGDGDSYPIITDNEGSSNAVMQNMASGDIETDVP